MLVKIHLHVPGGELQGLKEVTAMKLESVGEVRVTDISEESQAVTNSEGTGCRCVIAAVVEATLSKREEVMQLFRAEMQDKTVEKIDMERTGLTGMKL